MMIKKTILSFLFLSISFLSIAQVPKTYSASEVILQIKRLQNTGTVLYIAAHPDDENTRLISYLANEKCLRTGYLSLTRGDGGQNLIGSEQGIELGVVRSQELLAARRTDGGEQFFTRAYDFGYSKTPEETLEKWNHDSILADVVFVIRKFKPDVIITRFSTDGSGGHGHHTSSAVFAQEAFLAAADPTKFPEQLQYVSTWQPRRLFYNNASRFWNPKADMTGNLAVNVGGFNPLIGKSYGEIAAESRSMHRSQGFGSAKQRGDLIEYFKPIMGDTGNLEEPFSNIDVSWNKYQNGKKIDLLLQKSLAFYQEGNLSKTNACLFDALSLISKDNNPYNEYKIEQFKQTILLVNGIFIEFVSENGALVAQGDSLKIKLNCLNRSSSAVNLNSLTFLALGSDQTCKSTLSINTEKELKNNQMFTQTYTEIVCKDMAPSSMYWLKNDIEANKFVVPQNLIGIGYQLNSEFLARYQLSIDGHILEFWDRVKYKWTDPDKGENYRPLVITPPVFVNVLNPSFICSNEETKEIKVVLKAGKAQVKGELLFNQPKGWNIRWKESLSSAQIAQGIPFELKLKGEEKEITLLVNAPANESIEKLIFSIALVQTEPKPAVGLKEIKYDHIPVQTLFPKAEIKLVKLDVKRTFKKLAYIPGAGDEVPTALTQLGYELTLLTDEMLLNETLEAYQAIIIGVRAYNVNEKLSLYKSKLMRYVEQGGNLIVQYNTNSFAGPFKGGDMGPYPFKITRNRVTDENAKVIINTPNHPVFNSPNKISESDFKAWIQERSIYHAGEIDSKYATPITMNDPNEKPDNGALIIGNYGKGNYIYTGLVFFRELPAGVPGAYRLFVNLIELR